MPPYRARSSYQSPGQAQPPQIDVGSIVDAIIGGKASLTQQAILREKMKREKEQQDIVNKREDQRMTMEQSRLENEIAAQGQSHELAVAKAQSEGYVPKSSRLVQAMAQRPGTGGGSLTTRPDVGAVPQFDVEETAAHYDASQSIEVQKETAKRSRLVDTYVAAGLSPAKAAAAAENPSLASYFLGFHPPRTGSGSKESPKKKDLKAEIATVNSQLDDTRAEATAAQRSIPKAKAAYFTPADSANDANARREGTRRVGRLSTRMDSLTHVRDSLATEQQQLGADGAPAPAPAPAAAPAARASSSQAKYQHLYDAAAQLFKAGKLDKAGYDARVAKIAALK